MGRALKVCFLVCLAASAAFGFSQHGFLPAKDHLVNLVIDEPSGSSAVTFSKECAEDLTVFEEGSVQTYWGGTAAKGTVLKYNGTVVPLAEDGKWEFNATLQPEPNSVKFDWEDEAGKKGNAAFLLVWKKVPPLFKIMELGGKEGEHRELWVHERKDFNPPPFTILYSGREIVKRVTLGDEDETDLTFRNIVVPSPDKAKVSWEINLYNEEWLASSRTIGEGEVPEYVPFKSLQTKLRASGKYRYQLSQAINAKVIPGPQRELPIRQVASRRWFLALAAGVSSFNWESTDLQNAGTQATFASRMNPSLGATVSKRLNDSWEPTGALTIERVKFDVPAGKTSAAATAMLFSLGVGTSYYLMENWRVTALAGMRQEPLVRATSLVNLDAEAALLPQFKLSTVLRAATIDKYAIDLELGTVMMMGKSMAGYTISSASETYGKFTVNNFWEKYDGFASLVLAKRSLTASIETQSLTALKFELGMRFAP